MRYGKDQRGQVGGDADGSRGYPEGRKVTAHAALDGLIPGVGYGPAYDEGPYDHDGGAGRTSYKPSSWYAGGVELGTYQQMVTTMVALAAMTKEGMVKILV